MLRISKLTDYALGLIAELADAPEGGTIAAGDLASRAGLPVPTVAKVLKLLTTAGIVASVRGKSGGYRLTRQPTALSLLEVVDALEGDLALTDCSLGHCDRGGRCRLRAGFQRLNGEVRTLFARVRVAELLSDAASEPHVALASMRRDRPPTDTAGRVAHA